MDNVTVDKKILKQYDELCRSLPKEVTQEERKVIDAAFLMAYQAHDNAFRKSGEPYITHPLNVARIVVEELKLGATSVVAALLHDVPEDTEVTLMDIEKAFGKEVALIVEGLTKIKQEISWYGPKQAEIFRRFLCNINKDRRIILIKLADRLDNMRSLSFMYRSQQLRIASETKKLYAPIANRLGLHKIKQDLEDLYLKTTDPDSYYKIKAQIEHKIRQPENSLEDFVAPIERELTKHGLKFRIKKRVKSVYSIFKKMHDKGIPFEQIYDKIAVRIILDVDQERVGCWQVYGIITSLYKSDRPRVKDWIGIPKANGYESLHITVLNNKKEYVEVQIRTERMDAIASHGIAAHFKYKPDGLIEHFDEWLEEISRFALASSDCVAMLDHLEDGFTLSDEVPVFDENRNQVCLPKGSTVLDFAIYQFGIDGLHTRCAVVNNKIVGIDYRLKSHDHVKVKIDLTNTPSISILNIAVTPKAKNVIQHFFREFKKKKATQGKSILAHEFKGYGLACDTETLEHLREFLSERTITCLLVNVADKKIVPADVVPEFAKIMKGHEDHKKMLFDRRQVFTLTNSNKHAYELAKCCKPLPGQHVFGALLSNQKIRVHSTVCEVGENVLARYGGRIVETEWANDIQGVHTEFIVVFSEEKKATNEILSATRSFCVHSLFFRSCGDGVFQADITAVFKNNEEMKEFEDHLRKILAVRKLERIR